MPIVGITASSNNPFYELAQTYTTTSTYTVPTGVYQISGIAVARGGVGANGQSGNSSLGGSGGGGGGGGSVIGFWNYSVTPGQVWTVTINSSGATIQANFNANAFVSAGTGGNASGLTAGTGGTTTKGTAITSPNFAAANGGAGGNGGAQKLSSGNGLPGASPTAGSLWVPATNLGLPTNISSGSGGGGAGGGAYDPSGSNFYGGGSGAATAFGYSGGSGGSAFQDFFLNGANGGSGLTAIGGGGGGGGAYQGMFGAGSGGGGAAGGAGVIYIYER